MHRCMSHLANLQHACERRCIKQHVPVAACRYSCPVCKIAYACQQRVSSLSIRRRRPSTVRAAGRTITTTSEVQSGATVELLPTTSEAAPELPPRISRHLSQASGSTFRFTTTAFGGPRGSEEIITVDSGVQAVVDAACCDPPFTAVVYCPGTSAIQSAKCLEFQSSIFCCG